MPVAVTTPDGSKNLTAPILAGDSQYSVGRSYINPQISALLIPPVWDIASAAFFGVKLNPDAPTKSCTARSMAFRKELWSSVGGFPETVFLGEDTAFDSQSAHAGDARPSRSALKRVTSRATLFGQPLRQMVSYSLTDGVLGGRSARLWRNIVAASPRSLPFSLFSIHLSHCYVFLHSKSILPSGLTGATFEELL